MVNKIQSILTVFMQRYASTYDNQQRQRKMKEETERSETIRIKSLNSQLMLGMKNQHSEYINTAIRHFVENTLNEMKLDHEHLHERPLTELELASIKFDLLTDISNLKIDPDLRENKIRVKSMTNDWDIDPSQFAQYVKSKIPELKNPEQYMDHSLEKHVKTTLSNTFKPKK